MTINGRPPTPGETPEARGARPLPSHLTPRASEITTGDTARRPPQGQAVLAMLGLTIGLLLMALQLWLLTLAFDLYESGQRGKTVGVAAGSGLVFLGGLLMWRVLDRRPGVRRTGPAR
jgi:hypothetical protein